jgi:hypothetical protein
MVAKSSVRIDKLREIAVFLAAENASTVYRFPIDAGYRVEHPINLRL